MADQNQNNNNQNQGNQGQGQENSNKLNSLEANTMNSDIQSIKDQGGNEPKSYDPPTNAGDQNDPKNRPNPNKSIGSVKPPSTPQAPNNNSSNQGSENINIDQNFQPPQPMDSSQGPQNDKDGNEIKPDQISGNEYPPKKSGGKKLFITLLIIIVIIGAGIAAYILFFSGNTSETPVIEEETTEEEIINEEDFQVPSGVPSETENESDATEETTEPEQVTEETNESEEENIITSHSSLFSPSADTESEVTIEDLSIEGIKASLNFSSTDVPLFREVVMRNSEGNIINFSDVASLFVPSVFNESVTSSFNQDATYFTYTDSDGTWFGFAVELNTETQQVDISSLEENTSEARNFFITDPGTAGEWADGTVGEQPARFITFDAAGAALSYTWLDNTLLVSSNYSGAQAASSRIGN